MKPEELDRRLAVARLVPDLAHLPTFGLVVPLGRGPVCKLCGGQGAPIINGKHLNPEKWCERGERS